MDDGMLPREFLAMYESDLASYSATILDVRRMHAHGVLSELLKDMRALPARAQAAHLERDLRPGQVERLLRRRPRLLHPGAARYSVDILYTKAPRGGLRRDRCGDDVVDPHHADAARRRVLIDFTVPCRTRSSRPSRRCSTAGARLRHQDPHDLYANLPSDMQAKISNAPLALAR
jgi:hypothetical protein